MILYHCVKWEYSIFDLVGFSVCGNSSILFDSIESIEEVFNINMTHVGNVTPDLSFVKKNVLGRSIVSHFVIPYTVMQV